MFVLCASVAACGGAATSSPDADAPVDDGAGIEVPDVSGEDGASAVSDVEEAGFEADLADANDDPGFDSAREASGCEITDQDPAGGEEAAQGDVVTITVDCAQIDWESQEGAQWEAFDLRRQAH
jgi:beta-lactam-binding protein with PASTA domain